MIFATALAAAALQEAPPVLIPPAPPPVRQPVVPAPPLPANSPKVIVPPSPRTGAQYWVTSDDYPAAALRRGESGTVAFALTVGPDGRTQQCYVTQSSGSQELDAAACRLMTERGNFFPGVDIAGKPVPSRWASRFRWVLPPRPAVPLLSSTADFRFTLGPGGAVLSCEAARHGEPEEDGEGSECARLRTYAHDKLVPLRGTAAGPVSLLFRLEISVDDEHPADAEPGLAALKPVTSYAATLDVSALGTVESCETTLDGKPAEGVSFCPAALRFEGDGEAHKVRAELKVLTDGDPDIRDAVRALGPAVL